MSSAGTAALDQPLITVLSRAPPRGAWRVLGTGRPGACPMRAQPAAGCEHSCGPLLAAGSPRVPPARSRPLLSNGFETPPTADTCAAVALPALGRACVAVGASTVPSGTACAERPRRQRRSRTPARRRWTRRRTPAASMGDVADRVIDVATTHTRARRRSRRRKSSPTSSPTTASTATTSSCAPNAPTDRHPAESPRRGGAGVMGSGRWAVGPRAVGPRAWAVRYFFTPAGVRVGLAERLETALDRRTVRTSTTASALLRVHSASRGRPIPRTRVSAEGRHIYGRHRPLAMSLVVRFGRTGEYWKRF